MKILVTGSSGFVGKAVVERAQARGISVCSVLREGPEGSQDIFYVDSISSETNWAGAFNGVDCVVHCAARVHQMKESETDALAAYREVNTLGTLNLARQAVQAGVKRFVFISSIKVNGEFTQQGESFVPDVLSPPTDAYGLSKYEAEQQLKVLAQETGLEVVVIRPPLVYGPGVKANFHSMIRWVDKGIPLPLGAIINRRSLVFIDNLVDLILVACKHPGAANQTFLVSDNFDVSTSQLLNAVASAMGRPSRLLAVPMKWLVLFSRLIGKPQIAQRLCANLQVDIAHTQHSLGWAPPVSFDEGIKRTVQAYLDPK